MESKESLIGYTPDGREVHDFDRECEVMVLEGDSEDLSEAADYLNYEHSFSSVTSILFFPKDEEGQTQAEYLNDHMLEHIQPISFLECAFIGVTHYGAFVYDLDKALAVVGDLKNIEPIIEVYDYTPIFVKRI